MKTTMKFAFIAAFATTMSAAYATPLFSDNFTLGQTTSTNNSASGFDAGTSVAFGPNTRSLFTYILSNTAPGDARARTAILGNGVLTFSSDREVSGYGYDTYFFSTPINLSSQPNFEFDVLNNDVAGIAGIIVTDSANNTSQATTTLAVGSNFTVNVTGAINGGVDATHIMKIDFVVGGSQGEDVSLSGVSTVPEPATLAALGLGAVALIRRRRKA